MIIHSKKVKKFNRKLIARENISYRKALRIVDGLYREARNLGAISAENIMDGLEKDLRVARAIHRLRC